MDTFEPADWSRQSLSVDLVRAASRSETIPRDWTVEGIQKAVDRYVRFLRLARRHPKARLSPTRDIDLMWHLHMLHPISYVSDCRRLLGFVLDHDGAVRATPEKLPERKAALANTAVLWLTEYGEPYAGAEDPTT